MNQTHREALKRAQSVQQELGRRLDPEARTKLRQELRLADGLAIGATAASALLAVSAVALEVPIIMSIAVFLAGIGAYGAVKKLRVLNDVKTQPKQEPPQDRRSGGERRKENEPQLAQVR
jgi:hypothetical protein